MSINKLTQNDKFRSWLNKINELIDSFNQSSTDISEKAPKKHSSTETSYGLGNSIEYGHLKLSDSTNNSANVNNGVAATPYSVKLAYDLASEAKELAQNNSEQEESIQESITNLQNALNNKAPLKHSSSQTTYGVGNYTDYGHVKLSVSLDSDSGVSSGVAVAPAAIKTVNDKIITLTENVDGKSPIYHANREDTYGAGSELLFGHLKISDDVTLDSSSNEGIAASIGAVKVTYDMASRADSKADSVLEQITSCAPENHASSETKYGLASLTKYGHVKITDSYNLDSDSSTAIVPSAKALSTTYSLLTSTNTQIQEIQDYLDELKNEGALNGIENINDINLNTIINNGKYVSNYSTLELNYPYVTSSKLSILEVTSIEYAGTICINQTLYSESSVYIRNSYNGGNTWSNWKQISSNGSVSSNLLSVYFSSEYGNDDNSGDDKFVPVKTWDRVFEIINSYNKSVSVQKNNIDITLYLDRGTYENIPQFSDIPVKLLITSFYYETKEEANDDVYPGDLEENKPYIPTLSICNSNIIVSDVKIDNLIASDLSIVSIALNKYISISHIESDSFSIVYLGSVYSENILPLNVHNNTKSTSMLSTKRNGIIYDIVNGAGIHFKENITFTYLFECTTYSSMFVPSIKFTKESENIQITSAKYRVTPGSTLYYPDTLEYGDDTSNIRMVNSIINGYIWGGGSKKLYLRDDGSWSKILDVETLIVYDNLTLSEENIKNILLITGNYTVTIPKVGINASFIIKNVSSSELVTIHPEGITIDGNNEDIILRSYEFIQIVQYSETEYALITDNRVKSYNLMNMNLENNILTTDTLSI